MHLWYNSSPRLLHPLQLWMISKRDWMICSANLIQMDQTCNVVELSELTRYQLSANNISKWYAAFGNAVRTSCAIQCRVDHDFVCRNYEIIKRLFINQFTTCENNINKQNGRLAEKIVITLFICLKFFNFINNVFILNMHAPFCGTNKKYNLNTAYDSSKLIQLINYTIY